MKTVCLRTDAPKHNLVLMKLSTEYKKLGWKVYLNQVGVFDLAIGSWLFSHSQKVPCSREGGPAVNNYVYDAQDSIRPDYSLYGTDYSLGFTWRYCPRKCPFCVVPKQVEIPRTHHSIWNFHDSKFKKICLLNNNTFSDPQWKETFEEIWDAKLTVIDENGYDLRLIDEEKAEALKRTKFKGQRHYAWDNMADEKKIVDGLKIAPRGMVYVLVGYNTTQEEDFHRCQKIHDLKHDPYVMPYNRGNPQLRAFKRFVDTRMYRKHKTIKDAWKNYRSRWVSENGWIGDEEMRAITEKKTVLDHVYLADKATGQQWEHEKSPFSRKQDGGQRAVVDKVVQELKNKYGSKGYDVKVESK